MNVSIIVILTFLKQWKLYLTQSFNFRVDHKKYDEHIICIFKPEHDEDINELRPTSGIIIYRLQRIRLRLVEILQLDVGDSTRASFQT